MKYKVNDVLRMFWRDCHFKCGDSYESLVWRDSSPKPTEEEIQNKLAELQAEYEANQYQRDRAKAYPSWQNQLDTIYHKGIDTWIAEIKAIKDQYPKP